MRGLGAAVGTALIALAAMVVLLDAIAAFWFGAAVPPSGLGDGLRPAGPVKAVHYHGDDISR